MLEYINLITNNIKIFFFLKLAKYIGLQLAHRAMMHLQEVQVLH